MLKTALSLLLLLPAAARAEAPCDAGPTKLLVIGASQTGATWARSYFGNFLQKCLRNSPRFGGSFAVYGRGGTHPLHWLDNPCMDKIETIQRDPAHNHLNLGAFDAVPACKKRIGPMLEAHKPERMVIFFGDNLLLKPEREILALYDRMYKLLEQAGVTKENCFFLAPTYEMEVATKRNVPAKDLANTLAVNAAIRKAADGRCTYLDGVELMKGSPLLLSSNLLKRLQPEGMSGCHGAAANDNIHVCGEAARDFAERVCDAVNN
jgi:hypothetical protein